MAYIQGMWAGRRIGAKGVRADRGVGVPPAGPVCACEGGLCDWMNSPATSVVHQPIWWCVPREAILFAPRSNTVCRPLGR